MKTKGELLELVRHAVADTLRKKEGVRDDQKIGQDLGAESIDRIDLTFRLEEAVQKSLDEIDIYRD